MHHHEVASAGQCEIDMRFDTLKSMADKMMKYKYVVQQNTAYQRGQYATFMPKPIFGDNGKSGNAYPPVDLEERRYPACTMRRATVAL